MTFIPLTQWHANGSFETIYLSYNSSLNLLNPVASTLLPANPSTLWFSPNLYFPPSISSVFPFPSTTPLSSFLLIASPSPRFRGCLLYDEVHILRESGSHLHFSLSPPFGVSALLMQAQSPQRGERDTLTKKENKRGGRWKQEGGTWISNCSKYTSRSRREGGGVIYYMGFIKQHSKGQGTLRWPLVKDGKCKQS